MNWFSILASLFLPLYFISWKGQKGQQGTKRPFGPSFFVSRNPKLSFWWKKGVQRTTGGRSRKKQAFTKELMPSLSKSRSMAAGWHFFRNNVPQCLIFFANFERYLTRQKHLILIVQIAKIEHCDPGWPLKYAFLHTLKFSCLFLNQLCYIMYTSLVWESQLYSLLNECWIPTYKILKYLLCILKNF